MSTGTSPTRRSRGRAKQVRQRVLPRGRAVQGRPMPQLLRGEPCEGKWAAKFAFDLVREISRTDQPDCTENSNSLRMSGSVSLRPAVPVDSGRFVYVDFAFFSGETLQGSYTASYEEHDRWVCPRGRGVAYCRPSGTRWGRAGGRESTRQVRKAGAYLHIIARSGRSDLLLDFAATVDTGDQGIDGLPERVAPFRRHAQAGRLGTSAGAAGCGGLAAAGGIPVHRQPHHGPRRA